MTEECRSEHLNLCGWRRSHLGGGIGFCGRTDASEIRVCGGDGIGDYR